MNRLNESFSFGSELTRSLDEILTAVIRRARRGLNSPALADSTVELRRIFSVGLLCQSVLRVSVVRAGAPSAATGETGEVHPVGPDGPEALAREAGVKVLIAHRPLDPQGNSAPAALEQAMLLTRLGALSAEGRKVSETEDPLAGFVWEDRTPIGRVKLPERRAVTVVTARPGEPGQGLGIATVHRERDDVVGLRGNAWDVPVDLRTSFTLLVPHLSGPEVEDPHAWVIELTTS
jgi:hypothetical protein